ncbi:MAG: transposase family protein [bacterium]
MDVQPLLPGAEALIYEQVVVDPDRGTLMVHCTVSWAQCLCCDQPTQRVHRRYCRTLADLPWQGRPGWLLVQARRFFCDHAACLRRIFAERLPGIAAVHARLTERVNQTQTRVALSCGGARAVE